MSQAPENPHFSGIFKLSRVRVSANTIAKNLNLFAQRSVSDNVLTITANCSPTGGINSHYLPTAQGIFGLLISQCVSQLHDYLSGRPRPSSIQIASMVVSYTRSRFSPRTFFSTTSFLNPHNGGLSKEPSPIP